VLIFQTWAIVQDIINTLLPIVKIICVMNESQGYWLLSYAFSYALTLYIAMKYDVARVKPLNQSLIYGDFDSKL
jgi:hypothetical protein